MHSSLPARWLAFCDGSAAPNPGRMAYGVLIVAPDGHRTSLLGPSGSEVGCNNEAELRALHAALLQLSRLGARDVLLYSDNSVVVGQLRAGERPAPPIARLARRVEETRALMGTFAHAAVQWIPRHRNAQADALAREAAGLPPKAVLAPGSRQTPKARRKTG